MSCEILMFIPGMAANQQGVYEKLLLTGTQQFASAHHIRLTQTDTAAGSDRKTFALERDGSSTRTIEIHEIVWGNLLSKLSDTGPFTRFRRGLMVLGYWLTPKWSFVLTLLRHRWMRVTTAAPALVLVAWCYGAVVAAMTALGPPGAQALLSIPIPEEVRTSTPETLSNKSTATLARARTVSD
jgi:hypothetical protein